VRAWAELHPKVQNHAGKAVGDACPSWSARSSWSRSSVCPAARVSASRGLCGYGGTGRRGRRRIWISSGALTSGASTWRAHLPLPQAEHGMDDAEGSPPRTGRPLELAGCGRLHTAKFGARLCCGSLRLPWERCYDTGKLTPVRVHRIVSSPLVELGTPAKAPTPCGRSPGRPKGRLSGRAKRYPAIKTAA
jgi:hypothetical protein